MARSSQSAGPPRVDTRVDMRDEPRPSARGPAQPPSAFDRKSEQNPSGGTTPATPLILFDGVCNLCNASVAFVMRHDRRKMFRFASLQSATGQRLLTEHGAGEDVRRATSTAASASHADDDGADAWQSMVLIDEDGLFRRSTAVLRVLRRMGLPWSLASVFLVLPTSLRDWAYTVIARRRYRWFGKRDTCAIPTPEQRARFLE